MKSRSEEEVEERGDLREKEVERGVNIECMGVEGRTGTGPRKQGKRTGRLRGGKGRTTPYFVVVCAVYLVRGPRGSLPLCCGTSQRLGPGGVHYSTPSRNTGYSIRIQHRPNPGIGSYVNWSTKPKEERMG